MHSVVKYPQLSNIKVTDEMWKHYIHLVSDVIIPYQWDILNDKVEVATPSHCLDNFRITAGEMKGEYYGMVFQDTDVYKWLEAVAFSIDNGTGKQYEVIADEVIELIGRAQQPDGYLNTYYTIKEPGKRFTNLLEGHELYCAGHMMEAACAYYDATGKTRFLEIAKRYGDLLCQVFGPNEEQIHGYPGHQEVEVGLVKLYHASKESKYLDLAKYFIEERGSEPNYLLEEIKNRKGPGIFPEMENYDLLYSQSHKNPIHQSDMEGHAVRAMYMCSAMADIANVYEDERFMQACNRLWDSTVNKRMYLTGGIGSSGYWERFTTDYDLPNDRAYCESCASIGLMMFGLRMSAAKKNAAYMDVVEKALYNTVLAGISKEGNRYFYVNVLEVWPDNCLPFTSMSHVKSVRQKWFDVACCPTNIARTIASLGKYICFYDESGIYVNLFISSEMQFSMGENQISLKMDSSFVKDGKVKIQVDASIDQEVSLSIRIPSYAKKQELILDGKPIKVIIENGYLKLTGSFAEGHVIEIDYGMESEWIAANPKVRSDAGKVALMRGPFVYCLEEMDNGNNLSAVYVGPEVEVKEGIDQEVSNVIPCLMYSGKRMKEWKEKELYKRVGFELEDTRLKAVPYCLWGNRETGEMSVWQKVLLG
ncbi:MAG: glycoside hydrolase family 127 protein [Lachnospiraceae bacterium]|nr:glycoside hydrolase family 127 protein [Lachnospiraceae bacterium]